MANVSGTFTNDTKDADRPTSILEFTGCLTPTFFTKLPGN